MGIVLPQDNKRSVTWARGIVPGQDNIIIPRRNSSVTRKYSSDTWK